MEAQFLQSSEIRLLPQNFIWFIVTPCVPIFCTSIYWLDPCARQFMYSTIFSYPGGGYQNTGTVTKAHFYTLDVIAISPITGTGGFTILLVILILTCLNSYLLETCQLCYQDAPLKRTHLSSLCWNEANALQTSSHFSETLY